MTANEDMANAYLEHIQIFVNSGDKNGHFFRAMAEGYYGNLYGEPFLKPSGQPNWFGSKNAERRKREHLGLHFVSVEARKILDNGNVAIPIVVDHAVPFKILRKLVGKTEGNSASILNVFSNFYVLGAISKDEDRHMEQKNLKSKMPCDWDNKNPFARYEEAGIVGKINPDAPGIRDHLR